MSQHITLVTGKGGVGKSLVAAAIAARQARRGRKVQLVEFGRRSFYQGFLQIPPGADRSPLLPGVQVASWEGRQCLREYVGHLFRLGPAADLFLNNAVVSALVGVAPGLNELALTGKLTSGHRLAWSRHDYDDIVVDAYATGHFLALMRAPRGLSEAIPVGPMGRQCRSISRILSDPAITRYVVVTLAEELPVAETLELTEAIQRETGCSARVYCNKVLPAVLTAEDASIPEDAPASTAAFLDFLRTRLDTQAGQIARLEATYAQSLSLLPHCLEAEPARLIEQLAAHLETTS